jgi:hypothetical protein
MVSGDRKPFRGLQFIFLKGDNPMPSDVQTADIILYSGYVQTRVKSILNGGSEATIWKFVTAAYEFISMGKILTLQMIKEDGFRVTNKNAYFVSITSVCPEKTAESIH